ncbi:MAG: hypothetical protein QOH41_963 [Blastocatellia bacterium]|jgi:hypothetical protein|nr:hypothetical protein [Blastocatellia bacterium]
MNDQPSSQTTTVNPIAERQSNVLNEENSVVQRYADPGIPPLLGFLQLCADRRFHRCLQEQFQKDTGLNTPEDYWIHADAGGTPKMECQRTAPDYCYYDKKVRMMGWSAHGDICGGFGPNVPDEVIEQALLVVWRRKVEEYPDAAHFMYFATMIKDGDAKEAVVYCMKHEKGAD